MKRTFALLALGFVTPGLLAAAAAGRQSIWEDQSKLVAGTGSPNDLFGVRLSISGDRVLIGAAFDDNKGNDAGAAYVFSRSGTVWSEDAKLTAGDGTAGDAFGRSVSISGNTALIGAWADNAAGSYSGSAYVFVFDGTAWGQQAKLVAGDGAPDDSFGWAVSLSGDTALVGASGHDDLGEASGSAYVFVRDGTDWSEQAKLLAGDGAAGDVFGRAVSLLGDMAVIGAQSDDDPVAGSNAGSAYVFTRSGTLWSEEAKLVAADGATEDRFGDPVACSADRAVIGARRDDDHGDNSGSAYVFVRSGTTWSQEAKLVPAVGAAYDYFGSSVSISGSTVAVGSPNDGEQAPYAGAVLVYERCDVGWRFEEKLFSSDPPGPEGDSFGGAVAVEGGSLVAGRTSYENSGSAHAFVRTAAPPSTGYCSSKANTCGTGAISVCGRPSVSASSGFVINGHGPVGGRVGVLLYNQGAGPLPPYLPFGGAGNGVLCIRVFGMKHARGAASGGSVGACGNGALFSVDMNAFVAGALGGYPAAYLSTPGAIVHCQWWGRESPSTMFLTDGLQYEVGP